MVYEMVYKSDSTFYNIRDLLIHYTLYMSICRFVTNIISISFQLAKGSPNAQFSKTQFFLRHPVYCCEGFLHLYSMFNHFWSNSELDGEHITIFKRLLTNRKHEMCLWSKLSLKAYSIWSLETLPCSMLMPFREHCSRQSWLQFFPSEKYPLTF